MTLRTDPSPAPFLARLRAQPAIFILAVLLLARTFFAWHVARMHEFLLLEPGDGINRTVETFIWTVHFRLLPQWPESLPLSFWLEGALMRGARSIGLISSLLNFFVSQCALVLLFVITRRMFASARGALLAVVIAALSRPFLVLSLQGGMPDMLDICLVLFGCYFCLLYDASGNPGRLTLASLCFLLASAVRFEAWFPLPAFVLFCLLEWPKHGKKVLLPVCVCLWMAALWIGYSWLVRSPLGTFNRYAMDTDLALGGRSLLRATQEMFSDDPLTWSFCLLALAGGAFTFPAAPGLKSYQGIAVWTFAVYFLLLFLRLVPIHPIEHYHSLLSLLLFVPYAAAALEKHLLRGQSRLLRAMALSLFLCLAAWPLAAKWRKPIYSHRLSQVRLYHFLRESWRRGLLAADDKLLVEFIVRIGGQIPQSLLYQTLRTPKSIVFDRAYMYYSYDELARSLPEVEGAWKTPPLLKSPSRLEPLLRSKGIRAAVVFSDDVRRNLGRFMLPVLDTRDHFPGDLHAALYVPREEAELAARLSSLWRETAAQPVALDWGK